LLFLASVETGVPSRCDKADPPRQVCPSFIGIGQTDL